MALRITKTEVLDEVTIERTETTPPDADMTFKVGETVFEDADDCEGIYVLVGIVRTTLTDGMEVLDSFLFEVENLGKYWVVDAVSFVDDWFCGVYYRVVR